MLQRHLALTHSITPRTFLTMALRKSRVQNRGMQSPMKDQSGLLVRALNDELGPAARGRRDVVDRRAMLILIKRFQRLAEALKAEATIPIVRRNPESPEIIKMYGAINRFLRRFVAVPVIFPESFSSPENKPSSWSFEWTRTEKRSQPFFELALIQSIEKIAAHGKIANLKECAYCRRWLFARFSHQRFCSDECKESFHRSDPNDKKRRREWARNNYQLHKTKNVK